MKPNTSVHPAIIAVWAAVVAAGHIFPSIPMLGTGSVFSLSAALSPLSGIFFGPISGALCSAAGGFIGSLIAPHTAWMGMGTFIVGAATAFTSGCIAWGRWPGGIIVYLIGTVLWFSQETGRSVVRLPVVFYGAGFIALVAGSLCAGKILADNSRHGGRNALKVPTLWLCAFGGMTGGAAIGNFFSLLLYQMPRETWLYLTVAQPIERAVFSVGAALIGVPLLAGLPKIGITVGPPSAVPQMPPDTLQ